MSARGALAAALAAAAVGGLSACQSTQERSAELEAEGAKTLLARSGLRIDEESPDVEAVSTGLLTDENGSAVVVRLHNDSNRNLVDVPILIDVRDAKGRSVYRNDVPGIEPALAAIPYIPARGSVDWVHDQVLSTGKPDSVRVKVGLGGTSHSGRLPDVEASPPRLEGDPVSGVEATGQVVNRSGEEQGRLLLYVVARRGERVVAAGRGAIDHLKAGTKPLSYDVFFVGDPGGASLELTAFPTLSGSGTE